MSSIAFLGFYFWLVTEQRDIHSRCRSDKKTGKGLLGDRTEHDLKKNTARLSDRKSTLQTTPDKH